MVAPTAVSTATAAAPTNAWQINVAEIIADKATLGLRNQSFSTPQIASAKLDLTLGAAIVTGEKLSVRALENA